jgi:hypothetical protein
MSNLFSALVPIVAVGALYVVVPVVANTYRRFRGPRTVTCPETNQPADIELDSVHAAAGAAFGKPDLRVERCSRWPERHECGQECLSGVQ